jgi:hypothetical protein
MAEQPGWVPVTIGPTGIAIDTRTVVLGDGTQVTIARFRAGHVRFALHVGTQDPPAPQLHAGVGRISRNERLTLLAAFNGGFRTNSGAGGFEINRTLLEPLRPGLASFVIDRNGVGHVGTWAQDLPRTTATVSSVRQNLPPLIQHAKSSSEITQRVSWGATLGHRTFVARSALGEDNNANILYAASMAASPGDLATALIQTGVVNAMELDINPEWVQLALASTPGGPLHTGVPGQHRPADQYLTGWTRDFITVLAPSQR